MLVIDSDGTKLGLIKRDEALKKAMDQGLTLVEIAPNAKPPVAKILDFEKFRYDENKKDQAAKKHSREVQLKELWLSPRIADHDLETRVKKAEDFLRDGDKIQFRVKFKGREMAHMEYGFQLLNKIFARFGEQIVVEREPKIEGRSITAIIGKNKGGQNTKGEGSDENQKQQNKT